MYTRDALIYDNQGKLAQRQFISYLAHTRHIEDVFTIRMLEKVCNYAVKHHGGSKDAIAYFLYDCITELEFSEAVAFVSDDLLTRDGLGEKAEHWNGKTGRGYYYFFDTPDAIIGEHYFTNADLYALIYGKAGELSEKQIINFASMHEASCYRYEQDEQGNYINERMIYNCMY